MDGAGTVVRKYGLDALVVLAAAEAALELATRPEAARAPDTPLWLSLTAVALVVLPLLARRRFPFAAPAAVWVMAAGLSFVDARLITFPIGINVAGLIAAYVLGGLDDTRVARFGLVLTVAATAVVIYNDPLHTPASLSVTVLFVGAWLAGFALRERAERAQAAEERAFVAEREREAAARVAVAEERARIARELHDVVAHSVSVMVLQVGAVRHDLSPDLAEDREALERVEQAGRTALAEMRRLLGAMRDGRDELELTPQPGLDGLESLVEDVTRAGLPVGLHIDGERLPLPRAIDLSAYRIVQEGLTNALKHARATRADVTVRYAPGELHIEVRDDGRGAAATADGLGHGLVGVRERVKLWGGEMTAGPSPRGGYLLTARLPLTGDTR